jgi:hypothetical protein
MLFPNFDVPSVGEKIVGIFLRSRMSLSHLNGISEKFISTLWCRAGGGPATVPKQTLAGGFFFRRRALLDYGRPAMNRA